MAGDGRGGGGISKTFHIQQNYDFISNVLGCKMQC